jgi:hypothetical protein
LAKADRPVYQMSIKEKLALSRLIWIITPKHQFEKACKNKAKKGERLVVYSFFLSEYQLLTDQHFYIVQFLVLSRNFEQV